MSFITIMSIEAYYKYRGGGTLTYPKDFNVLNLINRMCPFLKLYEGIMILNTKTKNMVYQILDI